MGQDVITYSKIDQIKTKLDQLSSDVSNIPSQVSDNIQVDMGTVVEDIQQSVEDIKVIADSIKDTSQNSPAGILPPGMEYIKCASTDSGINVTYKPYLALLNDGTVHDYLYDSNIASRTKGVMVRYRTDTYPLDINDGVLAFIDEDVTEFVTNKQLGNTVVKYTYGLLQAKEKTHLVTGLTQNQYYYFTAFPYSTNNVYLEAPTRDMNNSTGISCIRCQWTGTKGTLTVNVTQDYDYKPLGEYTATMTPTAGGQAITKTQSGAATVVFSGLEAGEYTLSLSAPQYFTAPQSQSVTVVAGQSETVAKEFNFSGNFSNLSWDEIIQITRDGNASKFFAIGSTKNTTVGKMTGELDEVSISQSSQPVILVAIDHHTPVNSNKKHHLVLCTKSSVIKCGSSDGSVEWTDSNKTYNDSSRFNRGYDFRMFLKENYNSILPDLGKYLLDVSIKSLVGSNLFTTTDKLFVPSFYALGGSGYGTKEENAYPYFTSDSRRASIVDEKAEYWWNVASRSCWISRYNYSYEYTFDRDTGKLESPNSSESSVGYECYYRPLCFCIG